MKQGDIFTRNRSAEDGRAVPGWWRADVSGPAGRRGASPAAWVAGAVLLAAILLTLAVQYFAVVPYAAAATGIVFPQNGIESIKSQREGVVSSLQVKVGEMVEAGELIAVIPDAALLEEIEAAREDGASQQELEALYTRYQAASMIYTPIGGQVVELAERGDLIGVGDTVAEITHADQHTNELEIRAYVPLREVGLIRKGMEVRITPQTSESEEYGYLLGLVSGISDYPITREDVRKELGRFYSEALLPGEEGIAEVRVTLLLEQAGTGNTSLDVSTLCSLEMINSSQTYWEWLSK